MLNRILCIDDAADIRAVLQVALGMIGGFSVQLCASGSEAAETAVDFQPDLILLDVMMPDMDGPETLAALRKLPGLAQTPVVFMTGQDQPEQVEQLRALGALGILPKPFNPAELASQIKALWSLHSGS